MTPTALTIGNFDGVHLGHAALIRRAHERLAAQHAPNPRVIALCFDPHPATILAPAATPARLTTFAQRTQLLFDAGAAEVVRLEPTRELLSLSPRDFVSQLVSRFNPALIVEGTDFHFGRGRAGHVDTLTELGREFAFEVDVVPPVDVTLSDHHVVRASSTLLRWLISNGRMNDAAAVLGRRYALPGTVQRGDQRGRTIGFPTANLLTDCLLPADGVYACIAKRDHEPPCPAAVNVGTRPTVNGTTRRVEAYLLTDQPPALDAYGWNLDLEFVSWVRDQVRFASLDDLKAQLARDVQVVRQSERWSGSPSRT